LALSRNIILFTCPFYYCAKCLGIRYNKNGLSRGEYLHCQTVTSGRGREAPGGRDSKWALQARRPSFRRPFLRLQLALFDSGNRMHPLSGKIRRPWKGPQNGYEFVTWGGRNRGEKANLRPCPWRLGGTPLSVPMGSMAGKVHPAERQGTFDVPVTRSRYRGDRFVDEPLGS